MTSPAQTTKKDINTACFDGDKVSYLTLLREYIESRGCAVIENGKNVTSCLYYFVIGNREEVKQIFSRRKIHSTRCLILLLSHSLSEGREVSQEFHAKVACIRDKPITRNEALVLFGFLFTETDQVFILEDYESEEERGEAAHQRKKRHEIRNNGFPPQRIPNSPSTPAVWKTDEERISMLLHAAFHPKAAQYSLLRWVKFGAKTVGFICLAWVGIHLISLLIGSALLAASLRTPSQGILAAVSQEAFDIALFTASPIGVTEKTPLVSFFRSYEAGLLLLLRVSMSWNHLQKMLTTVPWETFFSGESQTTSSPLVMVEKIQKEVLQIQQDLAIVESDLEAFPFFGIPQFNTVKISLLQKLKKAEELSETLSRLATVYPHIVGTDSEKTYLLLFQNSEELRPTGGFIGSIGIAKTKDGRLTDFHIEDVYTIDGQLRGHVAPPVQLQTILQQEHWYLRDSNWDPDFPTSAEQAMWFLEKSIGIHVNGVIAVNLPFIRDLLAATGPLTVEGVGTVTDATIFGLINKEIQQNFFPGSIKKKTVLSSLATTMIEAILHGKSNNPVGLLSAISKGLISGELLLHTDNETASRLLTAYGWTGAFTFPSYCPKDPTCFQDILAPVEANLAVNKANFFTTRTITRSVHMKNGVRVGLDSIQFTNNSPSDALGGGDYTTYLRLYYPPNTTIGGVHFDDQSVRIEKNVATVGGSLPYAEFPKENRRELVLGVAFVVPSSSTKKIVVDFEGPIPASLSSYLITTKKQPGTGAVPFALSLDGPRESRFHTVVVRGGKEGMGNFVAKEGYFEYNTSHLENSTVGISSSNNL